MINIKETYPKSYKLLLGFTKTWLRKIQKLFAEQEGLDVSDYEYPEMDEKELDGVIDGVLRANIRNLYEFFDENQIYVEVDVTEEFQFSSRVGDNVFTESTRYMAEDKAFAEAFKILEEKL